MIISKKYAQRLVRQGTARVFSRLLPDDRGNVYVAIARLDLQRVDHYLDI